MLKIKMTKAEFETLPALIQAEYTLVGDTYTLTTDIPIEDTAGLRSALQHERTQNTERQTRIVSLETDLASTRSALTGNVQALETSWKKKVEDVTAAKDAENARLKETVKKTLVDDVALRLASELSDHPQLLIPHIKGRLALEEDGTGGYITRVLSPDGKPSALSQNEFKKEILDDPQFAPIITASRGSGSGAPPNPAKKGGGGAKTYDQMSESERTTLYHSDRAEFDRLRKASGRK